MEYLLIKKLNLRILDAGDNYGPIDVVSAEELEAKLSQAVRVYASTLPLTEGEYLAWDAEKGNADTHSAILLCVEELPKEKCKHMPSYMESYDESKCIHCGVKLKAEWKAEGE